MQIPHTAVADLIYFLAISRNGSVRHAAVGLGHQCINCELCLKG
jgi:hypothetical protein